MEEKDVKVEHIEFSPEIIPVDSENLQNEFLYGKSIEALDYKTAIKNKTSGSGTVSTVSVTTANGVSGTVANPTTTPAISITLGAITPSSVASTGTVTGTNLSGTNTGDQDLSALAPKANPTFTGVVTTPAITIPTGAGAGKVWTSDAYGAGYWAAGAVATILFLSGVVPEPIPIANINIADTGVISITPVVEPIPIANINIITPNLLSLSSPTKVDKR